jgi:hypothetical protein
MPNRVDPVGLIERARSLLGEPASTQSSQMQPRQTQNITLHTSASVMQPLDQTSNTTYSKDNDGILYNNGATGAAGKISLVFPLEQIPAGSKIYEVSIRSWVQTPNHADRWIAVTLKEVTDTPTTTDLINVTQQGSAAWATQTYSNTGSLPYTTVADATYFLHISLQKAAGDANTDVRLMWIKVKYKLPG